MHMIKSHLKCVLIEETDKGNHSQIIAIYRMIIFKYFHRKQKNKI